jgi:hypothetical protein
MLSLNRRRVKLNNITQSSIVELVLTFGRGDNPLATTVSRLFGLTKLALNKTFLLPFIINNSFSTKSLFTPGGVLC